MQQLWSDVRFALRSLLRSPGYGAVVVATLALGIGANSAIFSVVHGVVLKPLEYEAPSRLVMVHTQFPTMGFDKFWVSAPEYEELRSWSRSFEGLAIYATSLSSLRATGEPMRVSSASVSAELFSVLGVEPLHGRAFTKEEDAPGTEPTAVLSFELWQRAFGSDRSWIGKRIEVDGIPRTVLGVMPPRYDVDANGIEIWLPLALDPGNLPGRASHNYYVLGRLAEGVGLDNARAEVAGLVARWRDEAAGAHAPHPDNHPVILTSLHEEVVGGARPALLMLFGVVGLVLLVACANVANLLLVRAESRRREISVRSAMGASKLALLRQFLVESVLLSFLGCGVGLLLAFWGVRILFAAYPGSVPRAAEVGLDATVLLFALATALVTGVLFGLSPLLHLTRRSLGAALREGSRRTTSSRRALRQALVVSEIAVAVMLVVACGLLLRSFWTMQDVDAGFRADGLTTFQIYLPESAYPDPASEIGFLRDLSIRLREIPGVESASAMTGLPPRRRLNANDMDFEGVPETEEGPPHNVDYWNFVLEDYFETMQIPIVEGRAFEPSDDGAAPVAIVNETMAKTFWPGTSPVGRRVRPGGDGMPWITVVGVARDVKQAGLEEETGTEAYFLYPQVAAATGFAPREMNVVLRSSLPPDSVADSARQAVWDRDDALPVAGLRSMDEVLRDSLTRPRFVTLLVVVFAGLALLLAAVGTYGVLSYTVAERTSEIGIRMALGAGASKVLEIVLAQGMALTGAGLVLGMAGALLLARFLESFLFGVEPTDALTLLSVPLVLLVVALAACAVPAYRAMRVSPVEALRSE